MRARAEGCAISALHEPTNASISSRASRPCLSAWRATSRHRAVLVLLGRNEAVAWVNHPSLPSIPITIWRSVCCERRGLDRQLRHQGGRAAGKEFIDSLKLVSHLANVGDAKTLVISTGLDDASATGRRLARPQFRHRRDMIRLSVGSRRRGHHRRSGASPARLAGDRGARQGGG